MKDPRLDPNKTLIRLWSMMDPAEREAIAEYFGGNGTPDGLSKTLTEWTAGWVEEMRAEKAAIKPQAASNIIPFSKGRKKK